MDTPRSVGTNPALPWPLSRCDWLTKPERAERLAALRIGVALVLLWDVVFAYWPLVDVFFGQGSLGSPRYLGPPSTVGNAGRYFAALAIRSSIVSFC